MNAADSKKVFDQARSQLQKAVADPLVWGDMIKDPNLTVHTYDRQLAKQMIDRIQGKYLPAYARI